MGRIHTELAGWFWNGLFHGVRANLDGYVTRTQGQTSLYPEWHEATDRPCADAYSAASRAPLAFASIPFKNDPVKLRDTSATTSGVPLATTPPQPPTSATLVIARS